MRHKLTVLLLGGFLLTALAHSVAADQLPEQMIKKASESTLNILRQNRRTLESDPGKLNKIIRKNIIPYFNFPLMSRWVLGRNWNQASPAQQQTFVKEFQELLIRTYGKALLQYIDGKVVFPPEPPTPANATQATVTSVAYSNSGSPVKIIYKLRKGSQGWKVYDVSVENISLVINYRSTFNSIIKRQGIASLIQDLKRRNSQSSTD